MSKAYIAEPIVLEANENPDDDTAVLIAKISFIIVAFLEALIAGFIPTWVESCRENPKVMGVANSFAAGVFMAIAFMHLTPEMIDEWTELKNPDGEEDVKIFPLPEMLIFIGYVIILIIDKVLFDTHALFDDDHGDGHGHGHADPAEAKLETNLKASMVRAQ